MSQDRKRGFFGSLFGSKNKNEEELEAERESRQRIEARIREVLAVNDIPALPELNQQPAFQAGMGSLEIVYSGPDPAHSHAQSDQPVMQMPLPESDSLRIAPATEWFRPGLEQSGEFQTEPWRIRRRAANG